MLTRLCTIAATALIIAVAAPAALAWHQEYVTEATWGPGSKDHSGYNSDMNTNFTSFTNAWGGLPQMGLRYIDSNENGITVYLWSNTGWHEDTRYVPYGSGECAANSGNGYPVYVYQCYADNE